MSIKETFDVVKEALHERISSPILGSFAFFFVGCNWPTFVVILKSNQPIELTLEMLGYSRIGYWHSFFEPALFTLLFCAAYPWIKYWLSWYTDFVDTKRVLKRHAIELQVLKNRKDIIIAEGELEEIKEERIRKSEREKLKFEHELTAKSDGEVERHTWKKAQLDAQIDRYKRTEEAKTDAAIEREIGKPRGLTK